MSISLINQMNKEWFIFKGTHHQGPYSKEELEDFFHSGEITPQSLVWREGDEKWEALGKVPPLSFLLKGGNKKPEMPIPGLPSFPDLSDLPDLPDEGMPPALPKGLKATESLGKDLEEMADAPPPIPLDALLNPSGSKEVFKKEVSFYSKHSPKIILGSLVVVFAVVLSWFFLNENSSSIQLRIRGVMPVYVEKLQEIAAQNTPSVAMTMALSMDGKTLYASTNKDGEIVSIIKMKSLPKRILGIEDVDLMVRGVIKDHLGEYSRMQLSKGEKFVPGDYNIDFTGRKIHFLNRKFKFLNNFSFFKKLNTTYNYQTTALIYAGTPREFEKKLADYRNTVIDETLKPYNDKLERLKTFQSMLNKAMELYLVTLEKISKPSDIKQYETLYMKEISPIVQDLVVAASELSEKLEKGGDESAKASVASYASQVQLGKQIGEMGADMITQTRALKKLDETERTILKNKFETRYKIIKSQVDSSMTLLQDYIHKISN